MCFGKVSLLKTFLMLVDVSVWQQLEEPILIAIRLEPADLELFGPHTTKDM